MNLNKYKVCKRCLMDTSAEGISFDIDGICSFCTEFLHRSGDLLGNNSKEGGKIKNNLISKIKADGIKKKYDCIVGVSGGVDSSWALVQAVKHGLRPLAVHMDNGWNSELAQNNIANLVRNLNVDLYTHVINWSEYRKLMQAFFDADVIDIELLYDNAMLAVNYRLAQKYKVNYILSGMNQATEGMSMPKGWNWFKYDKKQIKWLGKHFGNTSIQSFPAIGTIDYLKYRFINKIQWVHFIDYFKYNKNEVLETLQHDYQYKPYPFKHYESIFTRFYQGYILPEKFKVDKRRLHLSTLIASGQMERKDAEKLIDGVAYSSIEKLEEDKEYFIKKMNWGFDDFKGYIERSPKPHNSYPSEVNLWEFIFIEKPGRSFYKVVKKIYQYLTI